MTRFLIFVVLTLIASTCAVFAATREIASPEARALLDRNRTVYVLDVRTPQEFKQARLSGAVLIPLGELDKRLAEIPKNRPILIYCAVGARSKTAADLLSSRGYKEVYTISDGLVGWFRNGYPLLR